MIPVYSPGTMVKKNNYLVPGFKFTVCNVMCDLHILLAEIGKTEHNSFENGPILRNVSDGSFAKSINYHRYIWYGWSLVVTIHETEFTIRETCGEPSYEPSIVWSIGTDGNV